MSLHGTQAPISVIGGGLAGCECAAQLARRGIPVVLHEQKPISRSPAHSSDGLAELVCSNSLRSDNPQNAIGLLHRELRRLGSVILHAADATRVPAGDALAVAREAFSLEVERQVRDAGVEIVRGEVQAIPGEGRVVVATGPLTSDALATSLAPLLGPKLYFYDAIAPIVAADSVDPAIAFSASRYGKGGADYLNLPMNEEEYAAFHAALIAADKVVPHPFEEERYFEGCLPIEVLARRGELALAYGPMKPVGLTDPRTGKRPFAVVQLRREDQAGTSWNLVGFQTRLTWPAQRAVFSLIPGLKQAEWVRLGQIHRNTYIDSPRLLTPSLALQQEPRLSFAGQISGVEGYTESAASGLLVSMALAAEVRGQTFRPPPAETALGALYRHITGAAAVPGTPYQPTNIVFGLFAPLDGRMKKAERKLAYAERGDLQFTQWLDAAA